jgi:hypothetical protein
MKWLVPSESCIIPDNYSPASCSVVMSKLLLLQAKVFIHDTKPETGMNSNTPCTFNIQIKTTGVKNEMKVMYAYLNHNYRRRMQYSGFKTLRCRIGFLYEINQYKFHADGDKIQREGFLCVMRGDHRLRKEDRCN